MKNKILQKKMKSHKHNLTNRVILTGCGIFLVLLILFTYISIKHTRLRINREFEEYATTVTMSVELFQEESAKLQSYLDEVLLTEQNRGLASNMLAIMNGVINNTEESISYMCKSMYYFERVHDDMPLIMTSVNLSATLINITAYEKAEEILQDVLDVQVSEEVAMTTHGYIYTNLAESMSQRGSYDRALECIELAQEIVGDREGFVDCRISWEISKAKCYLGLGKYEACRETLERVYDYIDNTSLVNMVSLALPFYEVKSMLAIKDGDLESAYEFFDSYLTYCETYSYNLLKLSFVDEFVEFAKKCGYGDEERIAKYDAEMLDYYRGELKATKELNASVMLDTYNISTQNETIYQEKYIRRIITYGTVILIGVGVSITVFALFRVLHKSQTDFLTGAYNRFKLKNVYKALLNRKQPFYMIIFDIDDFKKCNDVYGHAFGDTVLERVSKTVMKELPKMSMFFRYGGEEFVVLCDVDFGEEIEVLAERIRTSVEALEWEYGNRITISIGVTCSTVSIDPFREADENLYHSKKTGKNKVTYTI